MKSILVIDIGTSGIKGTIWSENLDLLATSQTKPSLATNPFSIVQNVEAILDELLFSTNNQVDILAFSCFGMCMVGLDKNEEICTFSTYRGDLLMDNKVFSVQTNHDGSIGPDPLVVGIPKPTHSSYAFSHMQQISRHGKEIKRYSTITSICLEKWTGHSSLPISYSEASWWGLLDWKAKCWEVKSQSLYGNLLPQLADFNSLQIKLNSKYSKRWHYLANAKLLLGIVDGAAATIGAAPLGKLAVTVATSAAIRIIKSCKDIKTVPNGCFVHVVDNEKIVIGGALTDGGAASDTISNLVSISYSDIKHSCDLPGRIVCLPFFSSSGERAPGWASSNIPGSIIGITTQTTKEELVVASVVGVALRISEIKNIISPDATKGYLSGSAILNSLLWRNCIGGSCGMSLWSCQKFEPNNQERDNTTSRGVALLAFGKGMNHSECSLVLSRPSDEVIKKFDQQRMKQRIIYTLLLDSLL